MALPFDATLKELVETSPADWLAFLGLPAGPTTWIESDLSAVTAQSDRVLRVETATGPWLLHLEFQSGPGGHLPRRLYRDNALLLHRHELAARSVVLLLRPAADHPNLTGELHLAPPGGPPWLFPYTVVRLWQQAVENLLRGGLGLLPLAPLANVGPENLLEVFRQVAARFKVEAAPDEARKLWTATYILAGLSHPREWIDRLVEGVIEMEESVTYQAIVSKGLEQGRLQGLAQGRAEGLTEGREQEARALVLLVGRKHLGNPSPAEESQLLAVNDVQRLERFIERLADPESKLADWSELLASP
jgi:predicted transposase YdaD